jgi:hypothetical protein
MNLEKISSANLREMIFSYFGKQEGIGLKLLNVPYVTIYIGMSKNAVGP